MASSACATFEAASAGTPPDGRARLSTLGQVAADVAAGERRPAPQRGVGAERVRVLVLREVRVLPSPHERALHVLARRVHLDPVAVVGERRPPSAVGGQRADRRHPRERRREAGRVEPVVAGRRHHGRAGGSRRGDRGLDAGRRAVAHGVEAERQVDDVDAPRHGVADGAGHAQLGADAVAVERLQEDQPGPRRHAPHETGDEQARGRPPRPGSRRGPGRAGRCGAAPVRPRRPRPARSSGRSPVRTSRCCGGGATATRCRSPPR